MGLTFSMGVRCSVFRGQIILGTRIEIHGMESNEAAENKNRTIKSVNILSV